MPPALEHRAVAEIRTAGRTLYGTAAPFNRPADIDGLFSETIKAGAFTATLARRADILALADHDPARLLARTRSGSLRLNETRAGLEFVLDLPDTSLGRDVRALAQRGDLGGVSIGFTADTETWPDQRTRELRAVTLHEISIVSAHPAYAGTSIALRARGLHQADPARLRRLMLAVL
jgi:HK97 family phage prohead protease